MLTPLLRAVGTRLWAVVVLLACAGGARAEDGYALWMRYQPVAATVAADYRRQLAEVVAPDCTPMQRATRDELARSLPGLLGAAPPMRTAISTDHALVLGTPQSSTLVAAYGNEIATLGDGGFLIRRVRIEGRDVLLVAARQDVGVLYGTFHLLRLLQRGTSLRGLEVRESPRVALRVLNHWDNLDRYVERGYAGSSLWDWQTGVTRATPITPVPTPRSASTAPSSTTSMPVR